MPLTIWRVMFANWNRTPWNALQEFLVDALVATLINLSIWLVAGSIAWAWLHDRRNSGRYGQ